MASTDFITLDQEDAGRVLWNGCFQPTKNDSGDEKYVVKIGFPKGGSGIKKLMALAAEAKKLEFGDKVSGVNSPFTDGNAKYEEDPEKYAAYKDVTVVTFKSNDAPTVFGMDANKLTAMNQGDFYSGCWAIVMCNAYGWTFGNMKKGVSLGFNSVQKIKDDTRLGGVGKIQTAEQAGFKAVASDRPESYEPAAQGAEDWL